LISNLTISEGLESGGGGVVGGGGGNGTCMYNIVATTHLVLAVDRASIVLKKQLHSVSIPPQGGQVKRRVPVLIMALTNSDY
jgi:hypothetical protein